MNRELVDCGLWTVDRGQNLTNHAIRLSRTDHATAVGGLTMLPPQAD